MSRQWFLRTSDGGGCGPIHASLLRKLAKSGKVTPQTLVSLDQRKWRPASQIKDLQFSAAPPLDAPPPAEREAAADDGYQLSAAEDPPLTTSATGGLYEGLSVEQLDKLFPTPESDEPQSADSPPIDIAARFSQSFLTAAGAASAMALIIQIIVALGMIELTTIASSLAVRVAIPGVVFVLGFVAVYWRLGVEVQPVQITAKMNDDEIARMINGR